MWGVTCWNYCTFWYRIWIPTSLRQIVWGNEVHQNQFVERLGCPFRKSPVFNQTCFKTTCCRPQGYPSTCDPTPDNQKIQGAFLHLIENSRFLKIIPFTFYPTESWLTLSICKELVALFNSFLPSLVELFLRSAPLHWVLLTHLGLSSSFIWWLSKGRLPPKLLLPSFL